MADLLTATQMKAIESAAIDRGDVTGLALMELAGQGVVRAVLEEWPSLATSAHTAVVFCGPGNNGGDGFVIARLLRQRGWSVDVFLYGNADKLPPDAATNCRLWEEIGAVQAWNDDAIGELLHADTPALVVDALFGTGLTRGLPDDTKKTRQAIMSIVFDRSPSDRPKCVAVDIPSGLCSDSGRNLGGAIPTHLTVSFHRAKVGHYLTADGEPMGGARWCGKVVVADIGLGQPQSPETVRLVGSPSSSGIAKSGTGHKYAYGHAVVFSGGRGHGGAARLAARSALRIGAGLVTVACPDEALAEHAAQLTAVMCSAHGSQAELSEFLTDRRLNAICIGPGLGTDGAARKKVELALSLTRVTVLDADALTIFAHNPAAFFDRLHEACVLTPHAGEFARLFPDIAEKLAAPARTGPAYSKVDAVRDAAARAGCVVLIKGSDTVIAAPDGQASVNASLYDRAAPWLATAGSGDVLAGMITGLLAQGLAPMQAAEIAAWLHTECALSFGPGLIAEDLPEILPNVLRSLKD